MRYKRVRTNMAAPSRHAVSDLRKVLEISRLMAAEVDMDGLLHLIIQRSMELLKAERASLFLYDAASHELVSRIAAGTGEIRFSADRGIAGATVRGNRVIHVPDAYKDKRFNREVDRASGFRTRNILSVPLHDHQGAIVGVLQVLNKRRGAFGRGDIDLARTLAAQAGVLLQRSSLVEHYLRKQEMDRAMKIARDIQRGLLPETTPPICGFELAGFCQPADETGGDMFDFVPLDDGRWMLVVADASGHGVGPALVVAETRAMLRVMALRGCGLTETLTTANSLLHRDLSGPFVTCFVGMLEPLSGRMIYSSAGHGPMLFYDRAADSFDEVKATTIPLGLMNDVCFDDSTDHRFGRGSFGVIMTDGFFEAVDKEGECFGTERIKEMLRRDRDLPAKQMIQHLHDAVKQFRAGQAQADDLTMVILRRR